jgi:hypothetical protein
MPNRRYLSVTSPYSQHDRFRTTFQPLQGMTLHLSPDPMEYSTVQFDSRETADAAGLPPNDLDSVLYVDGIQDELIGKWFYESPAFQSGPGVGEWRRQAVIPDNLFERVLEDIQNVVIQRMVMHHKILLLKEYDNVLRTMLAIANVFKVATDELSSAEFELRPLEGADEELQKRLSVARKRHQEATTQVTRLQEAYTKLSRRRAVLGGIFQNN